MYVEFETGPAPGGFMRRRGLPIVDLLLGGAASVALVAALMAADAWAALARAVRGGGRPGGRRGVRPECG